MRRDKVSDTTSQCKAMVYVKDCYRRVGGPRHFAMHYTHQQCKRRAGANGYCWQHSWKAKLGL